MMWFRDYLKQQAIIADQCRRYREAQAEAERYRAMAREADSGAVIIEGTFTVLDEPKLLEGK